MAEKGDTALHYYKPIIQSQPPKVRVPGMTGKRVVGRWGRDQDPEYTTGGLCESDCEDRKRHRGRFKDPIAGGVSGLGSVLRRATG